MGKNERQYRTLCFIIYFYSDYTIHLPDRTLARVKQFILSSFTGTTGTISNQPKRAKMLTNLPPSIFHPASRAEIKCKFLYVWIWSTFAQT
jgi:hypothetical protein